MAKDWSKYSPSDRLHVYEAILNVLYSAENIIEGTGAPLLTDTQDLIEKVEDKSIKEAEKLGLGRNEFSELGHIIEDRRATAERKHEAIMEKYHSKKYQGR